jgi:hypothetical protein
MIVSCTEDNGRANNTKPLKIIAKTPVCKVGKKTIIKLPPLVFPSLSLINPKKVLPVYTEKIRLNNRTLSRQRYKTAIYGGKKAKLARFHLVVLLWRLALNNEASLGSPPKENSSTKEVLAYRRKITNIKNYRTEALFHLDYLTRNQKPDLPILERYAYYLSTIKSDLAIPVFYRLLENTKPKFRKYYNVDFAGVLLASKRCKEASVLLNRAYNSEKTVRKLFMDGNLLLCNPLKYKGQMAKKLISLCKRIPKGDFQQFIPLLAKITQVATIFSNKKFGFKNIIKSCSSLGKPIFRNHFEYEIGVINNVLQKGIDNSISVKKQFAVTDLKNWQAIQKQLKPVLFVLSVILGRSTEIKINIKPSGKIYLGIPQGGNNKIMQKISRYFNGFKIKKWSCNPSLVTVIIPLTIKSRSK